LPILQLLTRFPPAGTSLLAFQNLLENTLKILTKGRWPESSVLERCAVSN